MCWKDEMVHCCEDEYIMIRHIVAAGPVVSSDGENLKDTEMKKGKLRPAAAA